MIPVWQTIGILNERRRRGLAPGEKLEATMPTFDEVMMEGPDLSKPPCQECGAMTQEEAETMCICSGDKDHCHGCDLWPD